MNQPLVSIIVGCYNQARFVEECLDSVRHQTYPNIQLIILDDCSQDDSVRVIRSWLATHNIAAPLVVHEKNRGVCPTFNEGLATATGAYISILAADDVLLPEKVERQVAALESAPKEVGVVYSDCLLVNEDGEPLPQKFIESHLSTSREPEGDVLPLLLEKNFIPVMTALVRKECYDKVGLLDETLVYEDYDMWLRIAQHYRFIFSSYVSAKYRIVSTSVSRTVTQIPSWKTLDSNFRIFENCLPVTRNRAELRRPVLDQLNTVGLEMYRLGHNNRTRHLLKVFKTDPRPFTLGLLIFSLSGAPYSRFSKVARWFESFKRRFNQIESR